MFVGCSSTCTSLRWVVKQWERRAAGELRTASLPWRARGGDQEKERNIFFSGRFPAEVKQLNKHCGIVTANYVSICKCCAGTFDKRISRGITGVVRYQSNNIHRPTLIPCSHQSYQHLNQNSKTE